MPIAVKSCSEDIVYLQLNSRLSIDKLDEVRKEKGIVDKEWVRWRIRMRDEMESEMYGDREKDMCRESDGK